MFKDWLAGNNLSDLNFDFIGNLVWASDGSLYGLYDPYWWGFSESGTKVVKLLGANGFRDLQVVNLANGDKKPSMIKIIGDYLYYRYAILDYTNQETGLHKVSRYNILSGFHEELFPSDLSGTIEVMSYDVASDNSVLYFAGANPQTNQVYNGRIDLNTGNWEPLQSTIRFSNVRVIE